jgi:hypothetical protein
VPRSALGGLVSGDAGVLRLLRRDRRRWG